MKILVTGGNGLLATEIKKISAGMDMLFCDANQLDITNKESVHNFINQNPGIGAIINCAAGRDAEILEENVELAEAIGVRGPTNLAIAANEIGATLVHFSSDYVFDGKKSSPYLETDPTNALSVYGRTKAIGEQAVLEVADTAIIFRTAWLLSVEGKKSFVRTIMELAKSKEEIRVVYDQVGSPTYAADLARMILEILPKVPQGARELYHLTSEGVCSWYDIAHQIVSSLDLPCRVIPIHSGEYPTKAKRPSYSVLDKTKVKKDFNLRIRHYSEGLNVCLQQLQNR